MASERLQRDLMRVGMATTYVTAQQEPLIRGNKRVY
jgi:hypothetical protein